MIQVVIVDDQTIVREGLSLILSLDEEIKVIGEASNGEEALELFKEATPDVVLMDIRMPVMDGVEATKRIKEKYPQVRILILTTFDEDEYVFQGLINGADGYMLKDAQSYKVIESIKMVHNGNMILESKIAAKVAKALQDVNAKRSIPEETIKGKYGNLTKREMEIAYLIAEGKSNKEISNLLYITEGTVKNHLSSILEKLGLRDRTQLALFIRGKQ